MRNIDLWQKDRESAEILPCGLKVKKEINNSKYYLKLWQPKGKKPFINYSFNSENKMNEYIQKQVNNLESWKKEKENIKKERKGTPELLDSIQVGDIFHNSWGYDQTQCDYYQIIEKSGRMVKIQRIASKTVEGTTYPHGMADSRIPEKDCFLKDSEILTKKLYFSGNKAYLSMEFGSCSLWDGKPKYCSWYA